MDLCMIKRVIYSLLIVPLVLSAQGEIAEIRNIGLDQVKIIGFTIDSETNVAIEGVGAGGNKEIRKVQNYQEDPFNLYAYAWIIDATTRELVWRMTIDKSADDWWNKLNRKFKDDLNLAAGEYELYYSAIEPTFAAGNMTPSRILEQIFGDDDWEEFSEKWNVKVSNVSASLSERAVKKYQRSLKESAVVSLTNAEDGAYLSRSFSLTDPLEVEVYCIGEGWKDEMFDYGWLIEANTRKKIWQMRYSNTEHAGGGIKNRVVRQNLMLQKGDYIVYYKSDDTHSAQEWNSNPPYDPEFWGITLFAKEKTFDRSIIKELKTGKAIIKLTRIGDNAYEEEGLQVEKSGNFRVHAVGEGSSGKMYDYGWIVNAANGEIVWKMNYHETENAGGASKNREVDEVIKLEKGSYIVYYKTDGSHSYDDWNSAEPREPRDWGISIYPVGTGVNAKKVNSRSIKSDNIIAELTRVRDDEHVRYRFSLDKKTKIRIKAIGEGTWDEMFDYGWIVNEKTGRKVWTMRFRNTDHAGGAKKNRLLDTIISLDAGTYTVHYISDDSHSYGDWNMSAPYDEKGWGITLYRID